MNQHKVKQLKRKTRQYSQATILTFLEGLKDVGLIQRLKWTSKILFRNFRLRDKKTNAIPVKKTT